MEKEVKSIKKFVFETEDERYVLDKARNYFPSTNIFLNEGCGYETSKKSSCSRFYFIRKGIDYRRYFSSISIENWRRIQEYASRFDRGERYNPETFVMPNS